jgi:hypothetical protein
MDINISSDISNVITTVPSSLESVINSNTNYNDYEVPHLLRISEQIEAMSKFNHIEVVRILSEYPEITLTENKYGIHINLTNVPNHIIKKLEMFINHVNHQEKLLSDVENQKEEFKNIYFTKDNKEMA